MYGTRSKVQTLIRKLFKRLKFEGKTRLNIGRNTIMDKPFIIPQSVASEKDKKKVKMNYSIITDYIA
jgi:hypothetical protein